MREPNHNQVGAIASFGAVALILAAYPVAAFAQSSGADGGGDNSRLDMTLDTGASPATTSSQVIVHRPLNPSAGATAVKRTVSAPLATRGGTISRTEFRQAPSTAPKVLAQLALVAPSTLPIRIERAADARILSSVGQGTYLAVVADGGDWWGVLMVNNTMGWVPKNALQMVNYQTEVSVPSQVTAAESPAASASSSQIASGGAAGSVAGLTEDRNPRTVSLLREAMSYLGVPYVWAGNTRSGIDCSGFVKAVFASQGFSLPRHSGDQAKVGHPVSGSEIQPGDRLYFDMGRKGEVSHCGIYLGNGYFIHASTNHHRVDVDSIFKANYYRALVAIRRS